MSSNVPPPYEPGPAAGQPEFLGPEPTPPATSSSRGRRNALIAGGVVGGLAVIGGGAWAASWYLSPGASAAEMLPAATIAYVEVNLDPSGAQKIAAVDTLNKFPAFADEVGVGSKDDLREKLFAAVQADGTCPDVDYGDDIEPWLGDRAALAAVDEGAAEPVAVAVLEVTDEDRAADGLTKLASCDDADSAETGFVVSDGWAYVAETEAEAQQVADLADQDTLADDDDYQRLTSAAGGTGVATAYVSPDAGVALADALGDSDAAMSAEALADFGGLALQVRFDDGALEVEYAGTDAGGRAANTLSTDGVDAVTDLPAGTGAALGVALQPGWGDTVLDQIVDNLGVLAGGMDRDELVQQIESATGLTVPADVETLLGSSAALAVSGEVDVDAFANSTDPTQLPVGLRVVGDSDAIDGVLDKVRAAAGDTPLLASTSDGDVTAVGPDSAWNDELVGDGALGDSSTFTDVVPDADKAALVLYLDADTGDDWLVRALTGLGVPADVVDNVEPIKAVGLESYVDDDLVHGRLTVTTD